MNSLTWLVEQLTLAEANGEKVHMVNHIPPGNPDCLGGWGREYSEIVER
jgi:sphingomyelin phosphodiesterase